MRCELLHSTTVGIASIRVCVYFCSSCRSARVGLLIKAFEFHFESKDIQKPCRYLYFVVISPAYSPHLSILYTSRLLSYPMVGSVRKRPTQISLSLLTWYTRVQLQSFGEFSLSDMKNGENLVFMIANFILLNIVLLNLLIGLLQIKSFPFHACVTVC